MPEDSRDAPPDEGAAPSKSKSERKRRMLALQQLGESLLELNERQLAAIPLEDARLLEALRECRRINSNSARRRHLQYIGKLMRSIDAEPIERALGRLHEEHRGAVATHHELEMLRDELLAAGPGGVDHVLERFPAADRQQLRQLVLQHQRERQRNQPPAASRRLFRYLRELQSAEDPDLPGAGPRSAPG
jgi:ribosome-associated protein